MHQKDGPDMGGDLALNSGGPKSISKNNFQQNFRMTFFRPKSQKIPHFASKNSDDFFSHRPYFYFLHPFVLLAMPWQTKIPYIELLEAHTNQKRLQCKRPREKRPGRALWS